MTSYEYPVFEKMITRIDMYKCDNLTDTSDIASLPAGLFSTPVKLSVPFY